MIKRKRSFPDDEQQQQQTNPPSAPSHTPDSHLSPRPSKLLKPNSTSATSFPPPSSTNHTLPTAAMLPSGHPSQPTPGQPQAPSSTMEETRQKYIQIQQGLRNEIQQFGQNHPRGIAAMKKLEQFNQHMTLLRNQQASQRQAAATAAAAAAAANQQAQAPAVAVPQAVPQPAAQARPAATAVAPNQANRPAASVASTSQAVSAGAGAGAGAGAPTAAGANGSTQPMKLLVPGHIDPDNADNWRREAEARLRTAYASMVSFRNTMQTLQATINNTEKPLSPEELTDKRAQLEQIQKQNKKCEDFINAFRMQQATLVRNAAANNAPGTEQPAASGAPAETPVADPPASTPVAAAVAAPPVAKTPAQPKLQPLQRTPSNIGSVGNAIAAAASAQNAASSATPQAGSQKSPTSAHPLRTPASATAFTSAVSISQLPPQSAPGSVARSNSISAASVSHPHGLQQAISQQAVPESPAKAPTTTSTMTPVIQREGASAHRLPIPKTLSMPAPTAVPVPPSRPTLPGGTHAPSGSQVVGVPAIAKAPQFELDEASGGLLSKRKLQELVRQIDPDESLDPEVEESILELTDDFVDTLLTYACRMAKHRGSDTLDIRDVQMILERNWNIRIPGYSMDDIRTVRKFNPTASYQQKLQALQAGKALNQSEMSKDP
ncbi:hypothetical protein H072_5882 [Dactylellina haptotyla CBS 200.50]|uniref:TBP-associated factor 12 n=1 Tax=Dactylellina haptotyla (strain CBS 200.50) TaxID=1284197 RepID=S8ABM2_DACHA|nr:hypothetical protein H072_5882 [Dactylellina haptotyla CBS 200.50]